MNRSQYQGNSIACQLPAAAYQPLKDRSYLEGQLARGNEDQGGNHASLSPSTAVGALAPAAAGTQEHDEGHSEGECLARTGRGAYGQISALEREGNDR